MTRPHTHTAQRVLLFVPALVATLAWGTTHKHIASVETLPAAHNTQPVRFAPLDVYIDTGDQPLGAWQVELAPKPEFAGHVSIVGIAGGDLPFTDAPYYDERAIRGERVIIADFETDKDALHPGRSRVAQVQLRIEGERDPDFDIALHTAARHDGAAITAAVEAVIRTPQPPATTDEQPENDG
ncbi:MAG: hypothetical protein Tsb0013_11100 [Phycisphaerales bacterium]